MCAVRTACGCLPAPSGAPRGRAICAALGLGGLVCAAATAVSAVCGAVGRLLMLVGGGCWVPLPQGAKRILEDALSLGSDLTEQCNAPLRQINGGLVISSSVFDPISVLQVNQQEDMHAA